MKRPEQPTKINEIDYRGKTAPALMTADVLLPIPAPSTPPPQPSLISFLSWHSIASRCCYGVDVRLPGHREHIRLDSLKPVTYRSGRVTLVHGQFHSKTTNGCRPTIFYFPENLQMGGVKAEEFNGDVQKNLKNVFHEI